MILLTGATGTIGTHLVDDLASAGIPGVRALVRDPGHAAELRARGLEPIVGTYGNSKALDRALDGAERLFLLSPAGDEDMITIQTRIVDAAARAGVRHVVKLSSIAADEPTDARIVRAHRVIEEHIERSGLTWTHLRPHWFMQNELGQAASVAADGVFFAPDVGRISLIHARDIAAVAARVLTEPGHEDRAYVLTGPDALTYAEIAETYAYTLARDARWEEVTLAEARRSMIDAGLQEALAAGYTEIQARYREGGITAAVSPDVQRILGRAPRTFAAFVADHRARFADAVPAA
ncbi:MAG: SDR family oxidoreductase [Solirubrobacteraceae bacterium]|nr:SDR family oxidoreductase [Solirubrobacteraceae bacterium]